LYHPPSGTGRDDNQEFCDAFKHVNKEAFYKLPAKDKAMHLLGQEKLDERQIKQLHRLRLELAKDEKSDSLNQQIKQRLLTL
jgi:DNA primase